MIVPRGDIITHTHKSVIIAVDRRWEKSKNLEYITNRLCEDRKKAGIPCFYVILFTRRCVYNVHHYQIVKHVYTILYDMFTRVYDVVNPVGREPSEYLRAAFPQIHRFRISRKTYTYIYYIFVNRTPARFLPRVLKFAPWKFPAGIMDFL